MKVLILLVLVATCLGRDKFLEKLDNVEKSNIDWKNFLMGYALGI